MTDLPVYQCHKRVKAAQIAGVFAGSDTVQTTDGGMHKVPGLFARSTPAVGDYLVEYDDGYRSHSPKNVFENGYHLASAAPLPTPNACMDFGDAIRALKEGERVARAGWSGAWLFLIVKSHWETTRGLELLDGLPWIGVKTADDKFVPWQPSQTDMLADDCTIVA